MNSPAFSHAYATALGAYVADRTERNLKAAYDLGREAVEQGMGVLDVAEAHNHAVLRAAGEATDIAALLQASGDFLIESLAAFEVVRRAATDARRVAWEERRRARMVRELSAVLADADIASTGVESAHELAQLVAEMLREITAAAAAHVVFETPSSRVATEATALEREGEEADPDEHQRLRHGPAADGVSPDVITAPIRSVDGARYGEFEIVGRVGVPFGRDDHATVGQVADLAAAWLDRTHRGL